MMGYNPKTRAHHCDVCGRAMNSGADLTDMRKPREPSPLRICAGGGCWTDANERGYFSYHQRRT